MLTRTFRLMQVTVFSACLFVIGFAQSGREPLLVEGSSKVPRPETVLGFKIGEDRKLAKWEQFVAYFKRLSETSDRIKLDELGKTTLGKPFVAATISSPENLKRLEEFKQIQLRLSDPRLLETSTEAGIADLIRAGRTVVVITCSIHATEVRSEERR